MSDIGSNMGKIKKVLLKTFSRCAPKRFIKSIIMAKKIWDETVCRTEFTQMKNIDPGGGVVEFWRLEKIDIVKESRSSKFPVEGTLRMRGQSLPRHPKKGGTKSSPRINTGVELSLIPWLILFGPLTHLQSWPQNDVDGKG